MISKTDLSGEWLLCLDGQAALSHDQLEYNDSIILPSTTSFSRKGAANTACEAGFLTDEYKFEGNAWFSKTFSFKKTPGSCRLFLERTRITTVYVNGKNAGSQDSLIAPHIYEVGDLLKDGENTVEICVSNIGYKTAGGHMTSQDTQTNWNGIVGEISLRCFGETYASDLKVSSDIENTAFRISADICGQPEGSVSVRIEGIHGNDHSFPEMTFPYKDNKVDVLFPAHGVRPWSDLQPSLYRLTLTVCGDSCETVVGFREFSAKDGKFTINGRKVFLRGKHDGMVFPKTGYAPTDLQSWLDVMGISRSYGINHYRFHTCCPPDAAFEAADMLGIFLEPQLPFWGTLSAPGEDKYHPEEQAFLIEEGYRMLRHFGNHPSFCMMSLGNELWGNIEHISGILRAYKDFDSRRLYTQGSNNFQWFPNINPEDDFFVGVRLSNDRLIRGSYAMCDAPQGHIQTEKPSASHNYDSAVAPQDVSSSAGNVPADQTVQIQFGTEAKTVKAVHADSPLVPNVPVVTHEIGQYETYPDFSEINKYTGPLKARNLQLFKKKAEQKGLLPLADKFFKASGKLSAACYKEELESVFRSKRLAGFQLLDLQDFPGQGTALVGILNAFMESKGSVSREDWLCSCSDSMIMAEFSSYVLESGETFSAKILAVNFSDKPLSGKNVSCTLSIDGKVLSHRETPLSPDPDENYLCAGTFTAEIPELSAPKKASFELSVNCPDRSITNSYDLWLYPKVTGIDLDGVFIFQALTDEAQSLLRQGKTVLLAPPLDSIKERSLEGAYCTDFWCYPMFSSISRSMGKPLPVGTMGLLIDNSHPALSQFPSEFYSTPQWWEIVTHSRSEILDENQADKTVIVRTIDNFDRCHSLGLLYEYPCENGKVVTLNADIAKLSTSPEGRQFLLSLTNYCRNK